MLDVDVAICHSSMRFNCNIYVSSYLCYLLCTGFDYRLLGFLLANGWLLTLHLETLLLFSSILFVC
jgi:hypothetical protein